MAADVTDKYRIASDNVRAIAEDGYSTACTVLTVVVALLALPVVGLLVGVALGMVWGAPGVVVLVAVFVGAPVIVALMVPEIYRWLRRTL